jgi:hypothetical protein
VLIAAVLAPGILAGGLLVGELTGYESAAAQRGMRGVGGGPVVLEPVSVPAPVRGGRRYEGVVPAVVRVSAPRVREVEKTPAAEERRTAEPVETERQCAGEWVHTWLWEMCREHKRWPGSDSGSEPGLTPRAGDGEEEVAVDDWAWWPA